MNDDVHQITAWLEAVSGSDWIWSLKYIATNDTYANPKSHQGGPYIAVDAVRSAFPQMYKRRESENAPDVKVNAQLDSHDDSKDIRIVYYNSKSEARITQWGSKTAPLVAADAIGSLVVFAFHKPGIGDADGIRIWMCRSHHEEDAVLSWVGPVEPGTGLVYSPVGAQLSLKFRVERDKPCTISEGDIPAAWRQTFPSGEAIIEEVVRRLPSMRRERPDKRLIERRECEYSVFRSVEVLHALPRIREGFATVDIFVDYANAVTNRRKSRSGRSLELHAKMIFEEERLSYSHGQATEDKRTPDFIFPSIEMYHDASWQPGKLRMLAAKTTCKDRWRQVRNEASRIPVKHLLTLQEGVSSAQFREMQQSDVVLVVPAGLIAKYPEDVRPHLLTLERFIDETRAACE